MAVAREPGSCGADSLRLTGRVIAISQTLTADFERVAVALEARGGDYGFRSQRTQGAMNSDSRTREVQGGMGYQLNS